MGKGIIPGEPPLPVGITEGAPLPRGPPVPPPMGDIAGPDLKLDVK